MVGTGGDQSSATFKGEGRKEGSEKKGHKRRKEEGRKGEGGENRNEDKRENQIVISLKSK